MWCNPVAIARRKSDNKTEWQRWWQDEVRKDFISFPTTSPWFCLLFFSFFKGIVILCKCSINDNKSLQFKKYSPQRSRKQLQRLQIIVMQPAINLICGSLQICWHGINQSNRKKKWYVYLFSNKCVSRLLYRVSRLLRLCFGLPLLAKGSKVTCGGFNIFLMKSYFFSDHQRSSLVMNYLSRWGVKMTNDSVTAWPDPPLNPPRFCHLGGWF